MTIGDPEQADLEYIEAALQELKSYLHSDSLFGSLRGYRSSTATTFPYLTLGGLLLALKRSRSRTLSTKDKTRFEHLDSQTETLKSKWRVAWEDKAAREYHSRLRQWGNYLNDLRQDADEFTAYYQSEVRLRAMIELLGDQVREVSDEDADYLKSLDNHLARRFFLGQFIWDEELVEEFPKGTYWYLWGNVE